MCNGGRTATIARAEADLQHENLKKDNSGKYKSGKETILEKGNLKKDYSEKRNLVKDKHETMTDLQKTSEKHQVCETKI